MRPRKMAWKPCLAGLGLVAGLVACVRAQPYTPRSDDEVLERLPEGTRGAEARRQRRDLAGDPANLRDSLELARSYLESARSEGDGRFLGYARAVLGPWWDVSSPPASVLALRGAIRLGTWEYERALADFREALARDPREMGAWRGAFQAALARDVLEDARTLLERWPGAAPRLELATARAQLARRQGNAREALDLLRRAFTEGGDEPPGIRIDAALTLAELARQLGDAEAVEEWFRWIDASGIRDVAALAARVDAWIDAGRFAEVVDRLRNEPSLDTWVVRLGEAWHRVPALDTGEADARRAALNQLEQRLEARRRRDDVSVALDALRFRLRVRPDPARALEWAEDLWAARRDPGDVRWILEAARADGGGDLARRVRAWATERGIRDAGWPAPRTEGGSR